MSDIKQVNVRLSPQDQKSLLRTPKKSTRKQRLSKDKDPESLLLHEDDSASSKKDATAPAPVPAPAPAPAPVASIPVKIPSTDPMPKLKKIVPAETLPPPPAGPSIRIQSKKNSEEKPTVPSIPDIKPLGPKILTTKKRPTEVPAVAQKKSTFFISSVQNQQKLPGPVGDLSKTQGVHKTMKKNYKERKISIQIRTNDQTKRFKNKLDKEIPDMPIANVKKFLIKSGVLKPKKTYPPDEILRSMMRDYMLLHTIE